MGIFTYLLVADAVDEMKRHNEAMERAALTPAERAAQDAARAKEEAEENARDWITIGIAAIIALIAISVWIASLWGFFK